MRQTLNRRELIRVDTFRLVPLRITAGARIPRGITGVGNKSAFGDSGGRACRLGERAVVRTA